MIKVNLVPQEILDKELQKQRLAQVSVVAGFLAVVFLGVSFGHYYKNVRLQKHLAESQEKFKRLEAIVKQVEELEAKAKAVKARLDVIQDLLVARSYYPRFMTDLLKALGDGIWLDSLAAAAVGGDLTVTMNCQSTSSEAATRWLRALQDSPIFKEPLMGAVSIAPEGTAKFTMTVKYKPAPAGGKK